MQNPRQIVQDLIMLAAPSIAVAQSGEVRGTIEEIVVTAQRIEQSIQDVPISVVAFAGDELELRGAQRIEDLNTMIPNVQITGSTGRGATGGTITVRGIPDVLNYVDGAWIPANFGLVARQVIEVERIEMLRGPQGTLFGMDATGGAIHYVTKPPADALAARLTATLGDYDRKDLTAAVDWPLGDTVKTKWTIASLSREGFVDSVLIDRPVGDIDNEVLRGDLVWEPNDDLRLRLNHESNEYRQNGPANVAANVFELPQAVFPVAQIYTLAGLPFTNSTHAAGYPGGELGGYESKLTHQHDAFQLDQDRSVLDVEWDITDRLRLKSVSTRIETFNDDSWNPCACELNIGFFRTIVDGEFLSQELQLHGDHGRVTWIAGAYYFDINAVNRSFLWQFSEFKQDPALRAIWDQIVPFPPPPNRDGGASLRVDSLALFGQATIMLSDRLFLSLGLRRFGQDTESDSVAFVSSFPDVPVGALPDGPVTDHTVLGTETERFDHTTPRVALEYVWNDNVMTYLSYSEGFNAGGVSRPGRPGLPDAIPYDPETVETTEIGLRSDWWERRIRLNATAFDTQWRDIQVQAQLPDPTSPFPAVITTNAAAGRAKGLEVELIVAPSDRWRFDLAFGLLDAAYTEVGNALEITLETPFGQAPEKSYSIGIQSNLVLGNGGRLTSRLDYGWLDEHWAQRAAAVQALEPAYGLLNAHIGYDFASENYRLALFGTNLSDEYYLNSRLSWREVGVDAATVGRPREVGLRLQASF